MLRRIITMIEISRKLIIYYLFLITRGKMATPQVAGIPMEDDVFIRFVKEQYRSINLSEIQNVTPMPMNYTFRDGYLGDFRDAQEKQVKTFKNVYLYENDMKNNYISFMDDFFGLLFRTRSLFRPQFNYPKLFILSPAVSEQSIQHKYSNLYVADFDKIIFCTTVGRHLGLVVLSIFNETATVISKTKRKINVKVTLYASNISDTAVTEDMERKLNFIQSKFVDGDNVDFIPKGEGIPVDPGDLKMYYLELAWIAQYHALNQFSSTILNRSDRIRNNTPHDLILKMLATQLNGLVLPEKVEIQKASRLPAVQFTMERFGRIIQTRLLPESAIPLNQKLEEKKPDIDREDFPVKLSNPSEEVVKESIKPQVSEQKKPEKRYLELDDDDLYSDIEYEDDDDDDDETSGDGEDEDRQSETSLQSEEAERFLRSKKEKKETNQD